MQPRVNSDNNGKFHVHVELIRGALSRLLGPEEWGQPSFKPSEAELPGPLQYGSVVCHYGVAEDGTGYVLHLYSSLGKNEWLRASSENECIQIVDAITGMTNERIHGDGEMIQRGSSVATSRTMNHQKNAMLYVFSLRDVCQYGRDGSHTSPPPPVDSGDGRNTAVALERQSFLARMASTMKEFPDPASANRKYIRTTLNRGFAYFGPRVLSAANVRFLVNLRRGAGLPAIGNDELSRSKVFFSNDDLELHNLRDRTTTWQITLVSGASTPTAGTVHPAGTAVTQERETRVRGVLKAAFGGNGALKVVVETKATAEFIDGVDLVIGSGATRTVVDGTTIVAVSKVPVLSAPVTTGVMGPAGTPAVPVRATGLINRVNRDSTRSNHKRRRTTTPTVVESVGGSNLAGVLCSPYNPYAPVGGVSVRRSWDAIPRTPAGAAQVEGVVPVGGVVLLSVEGTPMPPFNFEEAEYLVGRTTPTGFFNLK